MKLVSVCAVVLLALCTFFVLSPSQGCRTNPETGEVELDVEAVSKQLGAVQQDLVGLAPLIEPDDPALAENIRALAASVGEVNAVLEAHVAGGASSADVLVAIDLGLQAMDQIVSTLDDSASNRKLRVAVVLGQTLLRHVALSLG